MEVDQEKKLLTREFSLAKRPTFVKVDLSAILNNLKILKGLLAKHTGLQPLLTILIRLCYVAIADFLYTHMSVKLI